MQSSLKRLHSLEPALCFFTAKQLDFFANFIVDDWGV
jgi:hypothetical protein